jgi:hypothetical protein
MRPDLADRAIFLDLGAITDARRRSLNDLTAEFLRRRPKILGAIFDAIACGLRNLSHTKPSALPRMADFAIFATACETCSWPAGSFVSAYQANRADAVESFLEADPVASAVRTFVAKRTMWTGTATEVDGILRAMSGNTENTSGWPAEPRLVAVRLRELAASLVKVGVIVTFTKARDRGRARLVTIAATVSHQVPAATAREQVDPPASAASKTDPSNGSGAPPDGQTQTPREAAAVPPGQLGPAAAGSDAADGKMEARTIRQSSSRGHRIVAVERGHVPAPRATPRLSLGNRLSSRPTLSLRR